MFSRALKELVSQTRTWLCIGSRPGIFHSKPLFAA